MEKITLTDYLHTDVKDVKADLDVTYEYELEDNVLTINIDEVFVNGANITDLLDRHSFQVIGSTIHDKLAKDLQEGTAELRESNSHVH